MESILSIGFYFLCAIIISILISKYLYMVYEGKIGNKLENRILNFFHIKNEEMTAKNYIISIIIFSIVSILILLFIFMFQQYLPFNKENKQGLNFTTALHSAVSFVTNTNMQHYQGSEDLSVGSQMLGVTVQNFASAGVGISVLFALLRGITNKQKDTIGNFWHDIFRNILYVLIPLSTIVSISLVSVGVVQTMQEKKEIVTLEEAIQQINLGPIASQVAIKQLGGNGGGYDKTNSASPLENPNKISNAIEMISIIILPISLILLLGRVIKEKKQGYSLLISMSILLLLGILGMSFFNGNSMEGKETRFRNNKF